MGVFGSVMQFFRKGGAKVGIGLELNKITDHPDIQIDQSEYDRIEINKQYYNGNFPDVEFVNSSGRLMKRPYMSLNMMKTVCSSLASIIFNEQCQINVAVEDEGGNENDQEENPFQEYIDQVFAENDFYKNFERYLESCLALGGLVMRPYVDEGKIKISWCTADLFYPLKSNTGNVSEAAIASHSVVVKNQKKWYYTLLEFHTWDRENGDYIVRNELYKSDKRNVVGVKVRLSERYEDLAEEVRIEGLSRPLFVYLRTPKMNNKCLTSPLGLGICDNALTTLKQIDDTYDQFHREIKMGKRRVVVSDHFLKPVAKFDNGSEVRRVFNPDDDVFVGLRFDKDDMTVKDVTSDIRADQFIRTINHFIQTLEMQTELSVGTFSFDAKEGVKTATEVVAENSQTYRTRNSYVTAVEKAIKELITTIFELARTDYFRIDVDLPDMDYEVGIDFFDGVFTDKGAQLDFLLKGVMGGLMPKVEAMQRAYKIPEETAKDWIRTIQAEQSGLDPDVLADKAEEGLLGRLE